MLLALFYPSAKATFTLLFCFFLFPLYIIPKENFVYFVTIASLPLTEMQLNNPWESAAKAALWVSWQGCCWRRAARTPSQGCYTLSSCSACLPLLTVGHDLPPGGFWLPTNRALVNKPFGCLTPSMDWIHPGIITHQKLYLFHGLYWPHGKSCKYCLLSLLKLRRNGNVVFVHSRLNSFERKTKHVLPPFTKSFLQCAWRVLYFTEIWKGKGLWPIALQIWSAHTLWLAQSNRSDV